MHSKILDTKQQAGKAYDVLRSNSDIISDALIELESKMKERDICGPIRIASISFALQEIMFMLVGSLACCEENYRKKLMAFGDQLRNDAYKLANDPEHYKALMLKMGNQPKAACAGHGATPTIN